MTTTTISPNFTTARANTSTGRVLRTGAGAGAVAAVATAATAAIAHAAGVSLAVGGKNIPVGGFASMTVLGALVGTVLAVALARRSSQAARTFVRVTLALTVLSFLPDAFAAAPYGTRLTLALTHVVAAVIVIPAVARRLAA